MQLVKRIGPVIVDVLEASHAAEIVHKDVRRANILIIPRWNDMAKIIGLSADFKYIFQLQNDLIQFFCHSKTFV
jgi:hypothetical protein